MIFEITSIADRGVLDKERVVIKAREAGDIGHFALFRANANQKGEVLSGDVPNTFWFPNRMLKLGDFAVLYTKGGTASEKASDNGSTSFFYYWGMNSTLWDKSRFKAVLVHSSNWQSAK